jgi:succinate dehydrogenase / fumarate reductase membrane anchor subunit
MAQSTNSMRTPLAKVRGLGSAKSGVHHWWHQRLTAIAMVPLVLSAIYLVFRIAGSNYNQAISLLQNPFYAAILLLLIITGFWHCMLGIQVVIEDYVGSEWGRITSILIVKAILILLATLSALSLFKIVSI